MSAFEIAFRKRLSNLWKVEPFRLDVTIGPDVFLMKVDGKPPTKEQISILESDIRAETAKSKQKMN